MSQSSDYPNQFAGQYAVITGGTQGMGEAVARLFARRGAAGLVICGRNRAKGDAVAADLAKGGCKTHYVEADLAKLEDCHKIIATADEAWGKLHVLVNCAGVTDRGTILDTPPELFDRIFAALAAEGGRPSRLMIDATHLKAHRTAASLLKKGLFPAASEGPRAG